MSAGPRLRLHCDPTEGRGDLDSDGRAFPIAALSLLTPRVRTEKRRFWSSSHEGHSDRWVPSEQGRSRGNEDRRETRETGSRGGGPRQVTKQPGTKSVQINCTLNGVIS